MLFDGLIQRKLASLLRPWLAQEPEWEVKLGFRRFLAVARNLRFDVAALNRLIDSGGGEARLSFKSVTIEEVSFQLAHWSAPAFPIEVRGVHVTLFLEKPAQVGVSRRVEESLDDFLEKRKRKILAQVDPGGSMLHDSMEQIMTTTTSRTLFKNSITNLILMHCCLHVHDARVRVEFPVSGDDFSWLCYMREFHAGSAHKELGCLFGGFIGLVFQPCKETYIDLEALGLEVGPETNCHSILSFVNPYIGIRLKDLVLVNFKLSVPEMNFSVSPAQLHLMGAFSNLLHTECKAIRSGRLLWKIARSKIHSLSHPPGQLLYKVILVAVLWLRLVKEYEYFLELVEYSKDGMKMSDGIYFCRPAKQQWKVISEIEKQLAAESIASAWRVARCRVALKEPLGEDVTESPVSICFKNFRRIFLYLVVLWGVMLKVFKTIINIILLHKISPKTLSGYPGMISEASGSRHCVSLSFGKISTVISLVDGSCCPAHRMTKFGNTNVYKDLFSFCLLVKGLLFIYEEGICEQYLSFSVGFLEGTSVPIFVDSKNESSPRNVGNTLSGSIKDGLVDSKTILWGDPALADPDSEDKETGNTAIPSLEQMSGEMELIWKRLHVRFSRMETHYDGTPWCFCDIRTFWVYPALKTPDYGFSKCSIVVGKLNFALQYLSVLSIVNLIWQARNGWYQFDGSGGSLVPSSCSRTFKEESPMMNWSDSLKSHVKGMTARLFNLLPDKHIDLRAVIAGPSIQISVEKKEILNSSMEAHTRDGLNEVSLTINVHDSHFAVWPTAEFGIASCGDHQIPDDLKAEYFKLQKTVMNGFSEQYNINYASKGQISLCHYLKLGGLNAYFEDLMENQKMQLLLLKPVNAKFTLLRDYLHTFGRSMVASSLSLCGDMTGGTGLFYMDELSVILQVVDKLISTASIASSDFFGMDTAQNHQAIRENQMLHSGSANKKTITEIIEGATLSSESNMFFINASFELGQLDIILHNSRNGVGKRCFPNTFDAYDIRNLGLVDLLDHGIWFSVQSICINISVEDMKVEVDANFCQLHSIIFAWENHIGFDDKSDMDNAVLQSMHCLLEVSLSTFAFTLLLDCKDDSEASIRTHGTTSRNNLNELLSDTPAICGEGLNPIPVKGKGFASNGSAQLPSPWLLINSTISVVFMGKSSVKNGVLAAHSEDNLHLSVSLGGDFQNICLLSQGGLFFVETTALARFAHCFTSYLHCLRTILFAKYSHRKPMSIAEPGATVSILDEDDVQEPPQRRCQLDDPITWGLSEIFTIIFSQFSLVLLATDESGLVKEIMGKVDFTLKLWLESRRKFSFNLSYLDILYQNLDGVLRQTEKIVQMPHFSSLGSSCQSSWLNSEDSSAAALRREDSFVSSKDASCSSAPSSIASPYANDTTSSVFQANEREGNYILQQFGIIISAEEAFLGDENSQDCISQGWIGSGCVSGLNLTISLSEIQMLMATIESLSVVSGKAAAHDVRKRTWLSINHESGKDLETALPDGAIVAIQDVQQHMYITVEGVENKFRLAGAIHYSLVGRRALFRVKWAKRRWNFSSSCFSFTSLYAKNDSGDPLRLSYTASSGFVDIASNSDSACALWKVASCERESSDDADVEPLNNLFNGTFYLVNKKNNCGTAFIDGALEFVNNPGNPFKFKVFHGLSLGHDPVMPQSHQLEAHGSVLLDGQVISDQALIVPCITLTVEKASLTIVHELLDTNDKYPLLQGYINGTEVTVQTLHHKTRVMSSLTAILCYFDVHRGIWRELVHPIEICIYFRLRSISNSLERGISNNKMQSRLYIRMKELELLLTEISLDILLYVIGKLDLAGPFAVKNSAILANRCKVENQTELNLFCHFYDAQSARVSRRQSAFFSLRNLADQPLEVSYADFRLENPAMFSTSSIHVPLAETRIFVWRTRVMSLQDSRTSPGPFIVFDISKNAEEGLTVVVSPLLRICNQTGFPVELRIQRPVPMEADSASVLLGEGETVDDCTAAFDAINLFGGPKKALLSLGVGNFMFSFRPEMKGAEKGSGRSYSVEWSDNLKGGKAVRLSGIIDKLSYQVRKTLSAESWKYSVSTANCSVGYGNAHEAKIHFLVQTIGRDVPIIQPNGHPKSKNSANALQEQKEVFLLPTVRVSNLLESDIDVLLTETEMPSTNGLPNVNQATISSGSSVDLFANPATLYFTITLMMFGSSCKPVNCGKWLKKLNKKDPVQFLDIDLEFYGGKCFACLKLARDSRGILEAIVFTQYTLRNETEFPLFCAAPNVKPLSRDETERSIATTPDLGCFLPPKSVISWFMKSSKLLLKMLDDETSQSILDLDALSGLAEISFTKIQGRGLKHLVKFGVSLGSLTSKMHVPSRVVTIVPRYVVSNESNERIFVRQCFLEDDLDGTVDINSKQKAALFFRIGSSNKLDIGVLDKLLRKHRISDDDASTFVQFRPNEVGLGWSGPVCVASLGRFFLKFKRSIESSVSQSDLATREHESALEVAAVHVVEEASTFVLHFHRPPDIDLPYRIENHLCHASITYYQKDTFEPETLASKGSVNYVWDDLTRPRKLMVKINGINMLREISLDKLRPRKPFFRARRQRDLVSDLPTDNRLISQMRTKPVLTNDIDVENVGFEVYADGHTRVLRICDSATSSKGDRIYQSCKKIQFRISFFSIHLLEHCKQELAKDVEPHDVSTYRPIIVGRLENISLDSIFIDQQKYNQIRVLSMSVDEKWVGAPFASVLRRHLMSGNDTDNCILFVVFVLHPTTSSVQEVKYSSIILQPIDLNLDEETLMKIVPFWRKSLSTKTESRQYYFDHFEIHPIKIVATFIPDDSYAGYSSGQEALRSLLHSVIKIPTIKNLVVELNGVLVTHALVTTRELLLRCAQHYSWYSMRAIYIAKGSPLLPPIFVSVFDDLASSSLDVFFDPSISLFNVRGFTLGTFKLVSKCIKSKGFSGTKRYFGDLSKTLRNAGSSILFAAVTEVSDSVLKGAESSGLNGMVTGFYHGMLKLAMEPSLLGTAIMEGGPDRKIILDRNPGVDELYIEGYLQAMLDTIYKQEYLRVRVIDNQVILKNLPPNSSLIGEIMDRVKEFLISKALVKGELSASSRPLRQIRGEKEWRIGPTMLTLCEHLFVSFAIRILRKQTDNVMAHLKLKEKWGGNAIAEEPKRGGMWRWGMGRFLLSAMVAYVDGRLCRGIPNPVARRIVSGFLLSFLDTKKDSG